VIPSVELDHLVVAAATLAQGCDYLESGLGVRPQPGGKHPTMGTHNALLRLGPRLFLEVLAMDPDAPTPLRSRWFDLDEPRMRATLAEGPALIHWVARTTDIAAAVTRCPEDLGAVIAAQRGDLRWRITVPADGHLPGRDAISVEGLAAAGKGRSVEESDPRRTPHSRRSLAACE